MPHLGGLDHTPRGPDPPWDWEWQSLNSGPSKELSGGQLPQRARWLEGTQPLPSLPSLCCMGVWGMGVLRAATLRQAAPASAVLGALEIITCLFQLESSLVSEMFLLCQGVEVIFSCKGKLTW